MWRQRCNLFVTILWRFKLSMSLTLEPNKSGFLWFTKLKKGIKETFFYVKVFLATMLWYVTGIIIIHGKAKTSILCFKLFCQRSSTRYWRIVFHEWQLKGTHQQKFKANYSSQVVMFDPYITKLNVNYYLLIKKNVNCYCHILRGE